MIKVGQVCQVEETAGKVSVGEGAEINQTGRHVGGEDGQVTLPQNHALYKLTTPTFKTP